MEQAFDNVAGTSRRDVLLGGIKTIAGLTLFGPGVVANGADRSQSKKSKGTLIADLRCGTQQGPTTPAMLDFFRRHGITDICGSPQDVGNKGYYSESDLRQCQDLCARHGINLAMVPLPFLTSSHVDHERRPGIMLGKSPDRDRDIADVCKTIDACGKVGIPAVKYNMSLLGVMRTGQSPGRGGSKYSTWREADVSAAKRAQLTVAGRVPEAEFWKRIEYFVTAIMPTCESAKVRAACHPHDPGTPPGGLHGIDNVLGTVDGLKRFVGISSSHFHGLNFCVGTVAEMLKDPGREILDVVDWFASRGRIFNVHYRNIRGHRGEFMEVYPDEGDVDLVAVARVLKARGYRGMLMPDHVPHHDDDLKGLQAFAYAQGYIKGIIQALS
jgi:mannonate dehydratase